MMWNQAQQQADQQHQLPQRKVLQDVNRTIPLQRTSVNKQLQAHVPVKSFVQTNQLWPIALQCSTNTQKLLSKKSLNPLQGATDSTTLTETKLPQESATTSKAYLPSEDEYKHNLLLNKLPPQLKENPPTIIRNLSNLLRSCVANKDRRTSHESNKENTLAEMPNLDMSVQKRVTLHGTAWDKTAEIFSGKEGRLLASEYKQDIKDYLLLLENEENFQWNFKASSYLTENNRRVILNWLILVQDHLEMHGNVLFRAARLVDRFMCKCNVSVNTMQLVTITALHVSAKLDDSEYVPKIRRFLKLCRGKYTHADAISMEVRLFKALNFQVNISEPTPFLHYYLDIMELHSTGMLYCCNMFLDLLLLDSSLAQCSASHLAAGTVYTALTFAGATDNLLQYTDHKQTDLEMVLTAIVRALIHDLPGSAVAKKYNSPHYSMLMFTLLGKQQCFTP